MQANAESLPFEDRKFDFVVSVGVLHYTPDTKKAVKECHRVLRPGGGGMIALYYRSPLLARPLWLVTRFLANRLLRRVPGRETFQTVRESNDLVRMYDGSENPVGKCYSRKEIRDLMRPFLVERMEIHYFPMRFLSLGRAMTNLLHPILDRCFGLMIYAVLHKPG